MARGYGYGELDRLTRTGQLRRIRRGAYETGGEITLGAADQHRQLIEATVRQASSDAVVSHMSAAVLHDLPSWCGPTSRVHLTRDRPGGGRIRRYVHLHAAPLSAGEITEVDGVAVTSLARTVCDLARTLERRPAVSIGDAALARGLVRDELEQIAQGCLGWPGMNQARRVIAFLDGRSESPGESFSRVVFDEERVPVPDLQHLVLGPVGRTVGRSDFAWKQLRTLGEFDGRVKYGRLLKPGQGIGDVLFEEKRREDALRDLGWEVVRWLWEDLRDPRRLLERLERAFARGGRTVA